MSPDGADESGTTEPDRAHAVKIYVGRSTYTDSLGVPGSGASTYLDMMRTNVDTVVSGLGE